MSMPVDLPRFVQIEPVGECNLRCRMCPIQFRAEGRPAGKPPAYMDIDLYRHLIDQFPEMTELHLQGLGEPLLHLHFFEMVRYATARGIRVSTNTNLTVLPDYRAQECVNSGLHTMHVSLDAATPAIYEAIRVRARFEKVLRNLRRLMAAKARLHSDLPHVKLVCVVMRQNLAELPSLVQLAHDEGIDHLSVQHLCHDFGESTLPAQYLSMRNFIEDQTLLHEDPARIALHFDQARALARELGVELRLPRTQPKAREDAVPGKRRCDWPWRGSYISYDGKSMPCCMVATPDRINFGDMAEHGVARVWNNPGYTRFREQLESPEPPEICKSCAVYSGTF